METKISIITASYNYQEYIKETIESVIAQSYPNWEMIIVDDGSTDNSVEIIKHYCNKDTRIKLYQHDNGCNKGLAETIKLGISVAKSTWLVFLESDDTITPDYLKIKLQIIQEYPNVEFIFNDINMFGDINRIYSMQNSIKKLHKILSKYNFPANLSQEFRKRNIVPTFSCVMAKKELFNNIDFDNCILKPCLDMYLWTQIAKNHNFYYIPKQLTNWRMSKTSYINKKENCIKSAYFYKIQIPDFIEGKKLWHRLKFYYEIIRNFRRKFFQCRFNKNIQKLILFNIVIFSKTKGDNYIYIFNKKFINKTCKAMKLGISYNLFDGEELLESSLKSVRNSAFHINVVYQKESFYGEKASNDLEELLQKLKSKGLIDEIYLFHTNFLKHRNKLALESKKRDIGLKIAKDNGCTHFLSMDVDEFYDEQQLENVKKFIIRKKIDSSACSVVEYLKEPTNKIINGYTCSENENYNFYVPFIMKIYKHKKQKHNHYFFPCLVDPSRALNNNKRFYLFSKQDIEMHHMSTIRTNLKKKYNNSNYNRGGKELMQKFNELQEDILNWDFHNHRLQDMNYALFKNKIIKKIENKFGIIVNKGGN